MRWTSTLADECLVRIGANGPHRSRAARGTLRVVQDRRKGSCMINARKDREKALQDARFKINDGTRGVERVYAITGESHGYFKRRISQLATGKRALEFGCGNGANALELSRYARSVSGIDISDVAVQIGTKRAAEAGISNVKFH